VPQTSSAFRLTPSSLWISSESRILPVQNDTFSRPRLIDCINVRVSIDSDLGNTSAQLGPVSFRRNFLSLLSPSSNSNSIVASTGRLLPGWARSRRILIFFAFEPRVLKCVLPKVRPSDPLVLMGESGKFQAVEPGCRRT